MTGSEAANEKLTPEQLREKQRAEDLAAANTLREPDKSIALAMIAGEDAINQRKKMSDKKEKATQEPAVTYTSPEMVDCDCVGAKTQCKCQVTILLWVATKDYNKLSAEEKAKKEVHILLATGEIQSSTEGACSHSYKVYTNTQSDFDAKKEEFTKGASASVDCLHATASCHRHADTVCGCSADDKKKKVCSGACARQKEEAKYLNGEPYIKLPCMSNDSAMNLPDASVYPEESQGKDSDTVKADETGFKLDPFLNKKLLIGLPTKQTSTVVENSTEKSDDALPVAGCDNCTRKIATECTVASYKDLSNQGIVGDNLTPHHMPSNKYMKINTNNPNHVDTNTSYTTEDGICMNVQGQRHTRTFTYGTLSDKNAKMYYDHHPDAALKFDVVNLHSIYEEAGQYKVPVYNALVEVVKQNYEKYPKLFLARKWTGCYDLDEVKKQRAEKKAKKEADKTAKEAADKAAMGVTK